MCSWVSFSRSIDKDKQLYFQVYGLDVTYRSAYSTNRRMIEGLCGVMMVLVINIYFYNFLCFLCLHVQSIHFIMPKFVLVSLCAELVFRAAAFVMFLHEHYMVDNTTTSSYCFLTY